MWQMGAPSDMILAFQRSRWNTPNRREATVSSGNIVSRVEVEGWTESIEWANENQVQDMRVLMDEFGNTSVFECTAKRADGGVVATGPLVKVTFTGITSPEYGGEKSLDWTVYGYTAEEIKEKIVAYKRENGL
ncbi:hypothetical protein GCM10027418_24180 [Mariniluteicoccus endophyticus]